MKRYKILLLSLFSLVSCSNTNQNVTTQVVEYGFVIKGDTNVGLREYINLSCFLDGNETKDVIWESEDSSIASVSSIGMVKGMKVGKTKINATLKSDMSKKASLEITVCESLSLSQVINRFQKASHYKTKMNGEYVLNNNSIQFNYEEDFYDNSYEISSSSSYYLNLGIGEMDLCFTYKIENQSIKEATYFRDEYYKYEDVITDIKDISLSYFNSFELSKDNTYDITNETLNSFFTVILLQNLNDNELINSIYNALERINIVVLDQTSFEVNYFTKNDDQFKIKYYSINEERNTLLDEFLKTENVAYPLVFDSINKIYELSKSYNYVRDFGKYIREDGTSFDIGKAYYTKDYVYYDYSDEYIEETKAVYEYVDQGYVNIKNKQGYVDGVYSFIVKDNVVELQERYMEKDYNYKYYLNYYDFFENITLMFKNMEKSLYTFSSLKTTEYDETFEEYYSCSMDSKTITQSLFSEEITAFSGTSDGLLFSIKYNEENPSISFINYGGVLSVMGSKIFMYSNYPYTGFNNASVEIMEEFLKI